ncbi:MAG: GPW/gp25 family protein [Chitinophagales bacterium]
MNKSFLGTGWSFPPAFNKATKDVSMLSGEADIESSLHILLTTRLGERTMLPGYGCNLDEMIFETLTSTFKSFVRDIIQTAITYHEPRIKLNKVDLDASRENEGVILIVLDYTVREKNTRYNYVYPFYKNEGTEV